MAGQIGDPSAGSRQQAHCRVGRQFGPKRQIACADLIEGRRAARAALARPRAVDVDLLTTDPIRAGIERIALRLRVLDPFRPKNADVEPMARFPIVDMNHDVIELARSHEAILAAARQPRTHDRKADSPLCRVVGIGTNVGDGPPACGPHDDVGEGMLEERTLRSSLTDLGAPVHNSHVVADKEDVSDRRLVD